MEQLLVLILIVFAPFCGGEPYCPEKPCPPYDVIKREAKFEIRLYKEAQWVTTKIQDSSVISLGVAHSRIKNYIADLNDQPGSDVTYNWPMLITQKEDGLYLSWFILNYKDRTQNPEDPVQVQTRPESKVYVRVYHDYPSNENGNENADLLWADLDKSCQKRPSFSGAAYASLLHQPFHNEIWIYDEDICKGEN